jgi:hypothetical protein
MAGAHDSLKILESALGISAFKHLPYNKLVTGHVAHEPHALPFGILLAFIREKSENGNVGGSSEQHKLSAHFYPARNPNGIVETQFHLYDSNVPLRNIGTA